jgi:hypothetical protein
MIWLARTTKLETPETVTFVKQNLLKCIIFMTVCVPIVVILIMQAFQTADVRQVAVITGSRLK